ncbi:MAG: hypothetical protein HY711_04560 [Candidatus Melainabacteria bacterium]|nr:hypothetical protein [Candidatus Melainabacteria bacterium]
MKEVLVSRDRSDNGHNACVQDIVKLEMDKYLSGVHPANPSSQECVRDAEVQQSDGATGKFERFFDRFFLMLRHNQLDKLKILRQDHPILTSLAEQLIDYLELCATVKGPVGGVLRHMCYFAVPFMNSPNAKLTYSFKSMLPKVGLLVNVNSEPKRFIVDALMGACQIEDLDYPEIIAKTWSDRPYEYLKALEDCVATELDKLPQEFWSRFPNKQWLVSQVTYNAQAQIGLGKFLEQHYFDLLIIGAAESPLALTLLDVPREARPPVLYLCHGYPFGDPMSDLFLEADYVLVRGSVDKAYFQDLGLAEDKLLEVGSLSAEQFPDLEILEGRREQARQKLFIDSHSEVLVYALNYDIFRYKMPTPQENLARMSQSLKVLAQKYPRKREFCTCGIIQHQPMSLTLVTVENSIHLQSSLN